MKELSAAQDAEAAPVDETAPEAAVGAPDLQSLVDGIAALDRFDSELADFARSLESPGSKSNQ
jgi:hypothetical protein